MNRQNDEIEIDLMEILFFLKRKILIIFAAMLAGGIIVGAYSHYLVDPIYESTARLYILTQSTSLTSLADIQVGTSLTQDYKELIKSRTVVEQVIDNLNLNRTYNQMLSQMTIENTTNTRIISITIQDVDPATAKRIVDEFIKVSAVNISNIMATDEPRVIEFGNLPVFPSSPNVPRNIMIGVLLGLFLAVAVLVVVFILDDTVKTADDIEKYLGLNTLTSIPLRQNEEKSKKVFLQKGKGIESDGKTDYIGKA